ncbi:MAG: hypothetical protein JWQ14_1396 [Adhaeribacter sp.]|jgi:hypothetical protein|nr:hypothetical protein [Adhaeribacter sp.]
MIKGKMMTDKSRNTDSDTIKGGANREGLAGNLGDQVPDKSDNVLRMGAAALTGMGAESQVEKMSSGSNSFMAIGGSEGYTGDDTSGGGADPYADENEMAEEGSGTGSGVGAGTDGAGGGSGNDLAGEEGSDRQADGGGGAGLGAGGQKREGTNRPDTSVSPGGVGTDD